MSELMCYWRRLTIVLALFVLGVVLGPEWGCAQSVANGTPRMEVPKTPDVLRDDLFRLAQAGASDDEVAAVIEQALSRSPHPGVKWVAISHAMSAPGVVARLRDPLLRHANEGTPYVRLQAADALREFFPDVSLVGVYFGLASDPDWKRKVDSEAPSILSKNSSRPTPENLRRLRAFYVVRSYTGLMAVSPVAARKLIGQEYRALGMESEVVLYHLDKPNWLTEEFLAKLERIRIPEK